MVPLTTSRQHKKTLVKLDLGYLLWCMVWFVYFVFLSEYLMYFRPMFLHAPGKHVKTLVFSYFQWVYRKAEVIESQLEKYTVLSNKNETLALKRFLTKSNLSNRLHLSPFCITAVAVFLVTLFRVWFLIRSLSYGC